jgi:hypothetical protein
MKIKYLRRKTVEKYCYSALDKLLQIINIRKCVTHFLDLRLRKCTEGNCIYLLVLEREV